MPLHPIGGDMAWWEYEAEKKYPFIPAETDPEVDRAGTAGVLIFLGALAGLGFAIAGLFLQAWSVATWGMLGAVALAAIGGWLLPSGSKVRPTEH